MSMEYLRWPIRPGGAGGHLCVTGKAEGWYGLRLSHRGALLSSLLQETPGALPPQHVSGKLEASMLSLTPCWFGYWHVEPDSMPLSPAARHTLSRNGHSASGKCRLTVRRRDMPSPCCELRLVVQGVSTPILSGSVHRCAGPVVVSVHPTVVIVTNQTERRKTASVLMPRESDR